MSLGLPRRGVRHFFRWICLLSVILVAGWVQASNLAWDDLTNTQRTILQKHQREWSRLSSTQKQTLLRWTRLTDHERLLIRERHKQWQAIPPDRQRKIIRKLERYKNMPIEQRIRLKRWRAWVKCLPPQVQRELHRVLPTMNELERKRYIQRLEEQYGKH